MNRPTVELAVFIDVICPWCYVGKRRMEKALTIAAELGPVRVVWLPFQLNPDMPKEGMERRMYRMRKFGSLERSQQLDAQMTEIGIQENIRFRYDLMTRTPNTLKAHRLIWLARRTEAGQERVVEGLFAAYFTQGRDIGDDATLADVAATAGLDRDAVADFLGNEEGLAEVTAQDEAARRAGLSGVPAFIVNRKPLLVGAQPPEAIASALRAAVAATV